MITSLNINNVATYDGTGVQLNDLKKINFFFGFNGSGKSTIAKYLRDLAMAEENKNPSFRHCSNSGYNEQSFQILTFNEQFTEENFKNNNELKGVFSLNQTNISIDQQIESKNYRINDLSLQIDNYTNRRTQFNNLNTSLLNKITLRCWQEREKFAGFSKISLKFSGSKPNHFREINRILSTTQTVAYTYDELLGLYRDLYENELVYVERNININNYREIRKLEFEINHILSEVIIGNEDVDIAALINELDSRKWVENGLLLLEKTDDICPFCQSKTINADFKDQLYKYFDKNYISKINSIKSLLSVYKEKIELFVDNVLKIQQVYDPGKITTNTYLDLKKLFDSNIEFIEHKIQCPNEKIEIKSLYSMKSRLSTIIESIKENNNRFNTMDDQKKNLEIGIWRHMADSCKSDIDNYVNKEIKTSRLIELCNILEIQRKEEQTRLKDEIAILRNQTINTKEAIDNINLILRNTGFEGFEIDEKDTVNNVSRYYLKRNATSSDVFNTLSEGEKKFISFLYFYQLCIGTDDIVNNNNRMKIIVIDDPVSSMDSQALFVISTLIHSLQEKKSSDKTLFKDPNISQIFVFTHNIYFYKEVSFARRPMCTDYVHFKISKINNTTSISCEAKKPILDDYSLMWKTLKDLKNNLPSNSSMNILISNSMRRVIESYVNFMGYGSDSWAALINNDSNSSDNYIERAFISTINDESHKVAVLDGVYYQKIVNERPQLLFDVFASIFRNIGKEHYEMMMQEVL